MQIYARGVNYEGNGDLSQAIFDLHTHMEIDSLDFYYNRTAYFVNKKINADLITKINTNSLAFFFEKNDLLINSLPVVFFGRFEFLKNGYDMDFRLKSTDSHLHDIVTAMPPGMLDWLSHTQMNGSGDIDASLIGPYIASTGAMPDLVLNMKVRDGYIAYARAPAPVKNLYLDLQTRVPGLNPDSLSATLDSIHFNIDKDYFNASLRWKGMKQPWLSARLNSEIDLEKWDKAFGIGPIDLKGRYTCQLRAEGNYATQPVRRPGIRTIKVDTVVTSIPAFTLTSTLKDGYLKYASRPEAVDHIRFNLDASCPDHDYKHLRISLDDLNASVLSSYIKGFVRIGATGAHSIEAGLETVFHLSDIKKVYPLDSLDVAGDLNVHVRTKGNYRPDAKQFPITTADLQLDNGRLQTKYYPHPLEKIQVGARITSTGSSPRDLNIAITPLSFLFEGQPFTVKADLRNFQDLRYNIVSRGTLDIGKIYRVFALRGYDVTGVVETNLSLKGRQSDAVAGRYDLLFNKGTMKVGNLRISSELFPRPFEIHAGLFRFDQDKMWFDQFIATYGKSNFTLNGWLSNVTSYLTDKRQPLKGSFDLNSDYVLVDQFMAFAGAPASAPPAPTPRLASAPAPAAGPSTGVILVPGDLSLDFHADIKRVGYNGLNIDSFRGGLRIDSGAIRLDTTAFTLIGAPVAMTAGYKSLSPQRAEFNYQIEAKNFSVQRAYREVKIFHDLASSAAGAQGIISLNYRLAGRLDGNMRPVYPSLKGSGTLSVSKVKIKGLRLFSAVSKESGRDVNDPDLSKVEIRSTINNNVMTIERTRMKVSVFRLRMEGQTSFDGRLNLHFRVGLPPFGVIGIPLTITGTQDNPVVKVRRGNDKDTLAETEDKEEENRTD